MPDDAAALSRSGGFMEGLAGGVQEARNRQHQVALEEIQALRNLRMATAKQREPMVTGAQAQPFAPKDVTLDPNAEYPSAWLRPSFGAMATQGAAAERAGAENNATGAKSAAAAAALHAKNEKQAWDLAMEAAGGKAVAGQVGVDPDITENFNHHYAAARETLGLEPKTLWQVQQEKQPWYRPDTQKVVPATQAPAPAAAAAPPPPPGGGATPQQPTPASPDPNSF